MRHAAIIRITIAELAHLIGLADDIEVRGVMGLPITTLGPTPIDLLVVHDSLPEAAELTLPWRYDLAEVPAAVLATPPAAAQDAPR